MKDVQTLEQHTTAPRRLASAWDSPLWEDFPEEDLEDEEPPFDPEFDDLAGGAK